MCVIPRLFLKPCKLQGTDKDRQDTVRCYHLSGSRLRETPYFTREIELKVFDANDFFCKQIVQFLLKVSAH